MPLAIERREIVHDLQAAVGDELLDQRLTANGPLSVDNIPRKQQQRVSHRRSDPAFVPPELTEGTSDEWLRHLTRAEGSAGRRATTRSSISSPADTQISPGRQKNLPPRTGGHRCTTRTSWAR